MNDKFKSPNQPHLNPMGKVFNVFGALTADKWHVRLLHPLGLLLFPVAALIYGVVGFIKGVKEAVSDQYRVW